MKLTNLFLVAGLGLAISCGGSDPVPKAPGDPANPDSAQGEAKSGAGTLGDGHHEGMDHKGMEGMDHEGMDHEGMDHEGMEGMEGMDHDDPLIGAEMAAYAKAKPVFAKYCVSCHTSSGAGVAKWKTNPVGHLSMDSYPFGGHHADEVGQTILKSIGASGGKATMPKDAPGSVVGEERAAIVAWAEAFDKAHAAKAGHHKNHGGSHDH